MKIAYLALSVGLLATAAAAQLVATSSRMLKMRCQVAPGLTLTDCKVIEAGGADLQRQQGLIYAVEHSPPNLSADTRVGSYIERDIQLMQMARPIPLPAMH